MTTTCSKTYIDFPFAHRQHNHDGHCALIHGHNWSFKFTFVADRLDDNDFVVDFGKLKFIKKWLEENFDHTLVLNEDDPCLRYLKNGLCNSESIVDDPLLPNHTHFPFAKIIEVPNCGAEGLAKWVLESTNEIFYQMSVAGLFEGRRVEVLAVEVFEDSKNSACVRIPFTA